MKSIISAFLVFVILAVFIPATTLQVIAEGSAGFIANDDTSQYESYFTFKGSSYAYLANYKTAGINVRKALSVLETGSRILTANGEQAAEGALVGTGMKLVTGSNTYTIILPGDVNGDGSQNATDYIILKRVVLNTYVIKGAAIDAYLLAGQISNGNKILSRDYIMLKRVVLGTYSLYKPNSEQKSVVVSFDLCYDGAVDTPAEQVFISGKHAIQPRDPVRTAHTFLGWYADKLYKIEYDFSTPVKNDITIYAKWESIYAEIGNIDFDLDDLSDDEENNIYKTNPTLADTDGDGVDDGWEVFYGTDPLTAQEIFTQTITTGEPTFDNPVTASVEMNLKPEQVGTLEITPVSVTDDIMLSPGIPGYLGVAYEFSVDGEFEEAAITFNYDSNIGTIEDGVFEPRIYSYRPSTNQLFELPNQIATNGEVKATVSSFSKCILLNGVDYRAVWNTDIRKPKIDESQTVAFENMDVIFVVDESNSMENMKDGNNNDPDRIRVDAIKVFIDEMENGKDRAGIVGFADNPRKLTGSSEITENDCLQSDLEVVKTSADLILGNIGGTQLFKGINTATDQLIADGRPDADKVIIALTDGMDDPSAPEGSYDEAAQRAYENGITIYTIGLGSSVATVLLTNVSEITGGKYYHAEQAEDVYEGYQIIKDETVDYKKDTNQDGISDYYSKLLCYGMLRLQNGAADFASINFEEEDADYDGDGLLNGEEIIIKEYDEQVVAFMKSNPLRSDSDFDGYQDGSDKYPLQPDYYTDDTSQLAKILENSRFQYSLETEAFDSDFLRLFAVAAGATITFTDVQKEFTTQMARVLENASKENIVENEIISELFAAVEESEYSQTKDAIKLFLNSAELAGHGASGVIGQIESSIELQEQLSKCSSKLKTAEENLRKAYEAGKAAKQIGGHKAYVTTLKNQYHNIQQQLPLKFKWAVPNDKTLKVINKVNKGVKIAGNILSWGMVVWDVYDISKDNDKTWELAESIATNNANTKVFQNNCDLIIELCENGNRDFTRKAAQFIIEAMAQEYTEVNRQIYEHTLIEGIDVIISVLVLAVPALWVVGLAKAVVEICDAIFKLSDKIESRARLLCIYDMSTACSALVNKYYHTDYKSEYGRSLYNLCITRIYGESQFIESYSSKTAECELAKANENFVMNFMLSLEAW